MTDLPRCCTDLDILLTDLLFPERMTADGREFVRAHGIGDATLAELADAARDMGGGVVKIQHRCAQLTDDGRCAIYDQRPQLCRAFDCSTRSDCPCGGRGFLAGGE